MKTSSTTQTRTLTKSMAALLVGLAVSMFASQVDAQIRVRSIASVKGQETVQLRGVGLVVGLNGTGDPDLPTNYRALAKLLTGSGFELMRDLNGQEMIAEFDGLQNAALVFVTAEVPASGLRQGSRIRCRVDSFGSASSLTGGMLMEASLTGGPAIGENAELPILAVASGPVKLIDDRHSTSGHIENGCQVTVDFDHRYTYVAPIHQESDRFQIDPNTGRLVPSQATNDPNAPMGLFFDLVLKPEHANFGTATEVVETVREYSFVQSGAEGVNAAVPRAKDQVTIQVPIPAQYADDPVDYIGEILGLELHNKPKNTTVVIRRSGVVIIGDEVRFDPAAVTNADFAVEAEATRRLDLEDTGVVPQGPGVQLKKLQLALNQLQAPPETLKEIIIALDQGGYLYGELIIEE